MKKEIKEIDVKNLVAEINTSVVSGEVLKTIQKPKREKRINGYTYLVCSGCDFILNRTTKQTNKTFVCLPSQQIFYIYDELKDTKTIIDDPKQIKTFFSDKLAGNLVIEPDKVIYAKNGIRKSDIDNWYAAITHKSAALRYLLKRGLIQLEITTNRYYSIDAYTKILDDCYNNNPNLLALIFQKFTYASINDYDNVIRMVNQMYLMTDLDTAKYFIDKLIETSIDYQFGGIQLPDLKTYNLNPRRFIDYILFDLYKQGKRTFNMVTYIDYLNQCNNYYNGKITEKYPKYLETAHKIISQKVIEKARLKESSPKFAEIMSECESFAYQNTIDEFKIIMPTESVDLVEEGQYLCHCVASYVDKVNNGDCLVVFMRRKAEEDVPYLTIEILPDRTVPQVEGMNKRSELTEDEIIFINRWAKFKHLKITASNAIMPKTMKNKMKEKEIA